MKKEDRNYEKKLSPILSKISSKSKKKIIFFIGQNNLLDKCWVEMLFGLQNYFCEQFRITKFQKCAH